MQLSGDAHHLLDLLDAGHAFALATPEVVLDAHSHVQAQGDRHRVQRQHMTHQAFDGQHGAGRHTANELHHVAGVGSVQTSTNADPVEHQRAGVEAAANQPFDRLELASITEHEVRLDARSLQAS
ncbi:hypothetical protein D3C87_1578190 [compost metagenome]